MRQGLQILVLTGSLFLTPAAFAAVQTYTIDPNHTTFGFSVQHMTLSNVTGAFDTFSGTIAYSPDDLGNSKADVTIDASSIDTHQQRRDGDLKSAHFLDVAQYPNITFSGTKFIKSAITGNLTMHGITKQITVPVVISGPVKNMMGGQSIGITGSTIINRKDWGINFNKTLDNGGAVVGDEVTLNISIEADAK